MAGKRAAEKEKPVELGFVEEKESWKLSSSYFVSKVGGRPSWLDLKNLPKTSDLKCPNCDGPTKFLLQIYAPQDEETTFHRTLFLFVCPQKRCCVERNSNKNWVIFRCQLERANEFYSPDPPNYNKAAALSLNPTKFGIKLCRVCGSRGPANCGTCGRISYCSKEHQKLDWKEHKAECSDAHFKLENSIREKDEWNFPELEIVIETEVIPKNKEREKNEKEKMEEYEKLMQEGKAGTMDGVSNKDLLEAASYKSDKTFNKFRKRVDYSPEQVLRYDLGGEPLWVSKENTIELTAITPCPLCQGPRVFEFQVMPQLLIHLGLDPMDPLDWGTVVIYTCKANCSSTEVAYKKEFVWKQDYKHDVGNKDDLE